jgi:cell division protein FtsI/penicillin-binding protein 2
MRRLFTFRVRLVAAVFVGIAALLLVRLYVVQIVSGEEFRERAESQYIAHGVATDSRRDIFFNDINGELITAAVMESGYKVAINPTQITDAKSAYANINKVVSIDENRFFNSANKTGDPYEEVAFHISKEDAESIKKLDLPGVLLVSEKWRVYPADERAAHVLGFVGFKDDKREGRYGLERYWEDVLAGNADDVNVNFFAEIFSNIGALATNRLKAEGDIVTSIEPTVEQRLEEAIGDVSEKYSSRITGGIVMDPRDGRIIAMASNPTFNPNTYNTASDSSVFSNPMIESVFEFGSIMKPLTMASGIDAGAITENTEYNDRGFIIRDGSRVSNYDGKARGRVNMQEVLNQSLNTGAAFVAEELGLDVFARYMFSLGFGEETGIDLPGEVPGIVSGLKSGSALDLVSASFGQGVAVTPIAMTRALATLANQGVMVTPHVANQIRSQSGIRRSAWQKDERRIFASESTDVVTRMLVEVVDTALLEGKIKLPRHTVAAKTGTAQIANPNGGYYEDRYLHSFFGYFPAHDPQWEFRMLPRP